MNCNLLNMNEYKTKFMDNVNYPGYNGLIAAIKNYRETCHQPLLEGILVAPSYPNYQTIGYTTT